MMPSISDSFPRSRAGTSTGFIGRLETYLKEAGQLSWTKRSFHATTSASKQAMREKFPTQFLRS